MAEAVFWPDPPAKRHWPWRLGRLLTRVDVWVLIATVAGAVIGYLTRVKPH